MLENDIAFLNQSKGTSMIYNAYVNIKYLYPSVIMRLKEKNSGLLSPGTGLTYTLTMFSKPPNFIPLPNMG